jgi:phosphoserine phosphatase RsbU/P
MTLMMEHSSISAEQMKLVLDVSRLLAVTPDLDTLLRRIAESATSLLNAERASIFLHDARTNELWTKVALNSKEIRVPANAGIVGACFVANELLDVPRPYDDARFNREVDRRTGFVTRNLLTMPTRDMARKPIGVLQVVNRVGGEFSDSDKLMIEMLADQAGVAIQRYYLQQEVVKGAELRHEMDLAHKVQAAMIPAKPPQLEGFQAAGWTLPASVTGGDVYDLWEMNDGRLGIFLGDASGHGIAPAIVISQARTLVRALADINCDPVWLLTKVNARLAADLEPGRFATVFLGCLSGEGQLKWCSAGHGPMLYRKGLAGKFELLEPSGPPIGVLTELNCDPTCETELEPGGILIAMSDGIFEARSPDGELFEVERVTKIVEEDPNRSPQQIVTAIQHAVYDWQGGEPPCDDQSMVVIQRDRW